MLLRKIRKISVCFAILLIVATLGLGACSTGGEEEADKGAIEKMTDRAADEATEKIRKPLDAAKMTRELGDERLDQMEKGIAAQEQTDR